MLKKKSLMIYAAKSEKQFLTKKIGLCLKKTSETFT